MKKIKPHNGGQWTEARYKSFIISALRGASRRWGPKNECIKRARVARGKYKCEICGNIVPLTKKVGQRKKKQIVADHIKPIVDPKKGFIDYNTWIERCFVELNGFQAICIDCHNKKTNKEKEIAKKRRQKEKLKK